MKIPLIFRVLGAIRTRIDNFPFSQKVFDSLSSKTIFFVQIGANDGVSEDPIFKYNENWEGILIEPIPQVYSKLIENYKHKSVGKQFKNIAIGDSNGTLKLKIPIENEENKDYRHKLVSFVDNNTTIGMDFEYLEMNTLTLDRLIQINNLTKVDLLILDVEGYELKILNAFSFQIKPQIIYMETRFFCYDEMVIFNNRMQQLGYRIFPEKDNCLYMLK